MCLAVNAFVSECIIGSAKRGLWFSQARLLMFENLIRQSVSFVETPLAASSKAPGTTNKSVAIAICLRRRAVVGVANR
jgi:hypothetical protein